MPVCCLLSPTSIVSRHLPAPQVRLLSSTAATMATPRPRRSFARSRDTRQGCVSWLCRADTDGRPWSRRWRHLRSQVVAANGGIYMPIIGPSLQGAHPAACAARTHVSPAPLKGHTEQALRHTCTPSRCCLSLASSLSRSSQRAQRLVEASCSCSKSSRLLSLSLCSPSPRTLGALKPRAHENGLKLCELGR